MNNWINPPLHIICGKCGCKNEISFKINPTGNCNTEGDEYPAVFVSCDNCGTLTGLDEVIPQKGNLLLPKTYTEENMREAICEAWNSCEDNEDDEPFTEVFNRILKSLK